MLLLTASKPSQCIEWESEYRSCRKYRFQALMKESILRINNKRWKNAQ